MMQVHSSIGSQAAGDDTLEEPAQRASKAPVNAPIASEIRHENHIQAGQ